MRYLSTSLSAAALLHASASAGVLVVGPPGSGAGFSDVQPAIDAAQPGDTVLVLAGGYTTATITKPLQLLGVGSDLVRLVGWNTGPVLEVTSIAAGETVVVAGFHLATQYVAVTYPEVMARVANNGGTVVLQDIVLQDQVFWTHYMSGGLEVASSWLVLIESCVLVGGQGIVKTSPAISAAASTVWMMNSTIRGGSYGGYPGSDAIQSFASTLYLADCNVRGGKGGLSAGCGLAGGDGVSMNGGLLKAVGPEGHIGGGDASLTTLTTFCPPGAGPGGVGLRLADGAQAIVATSLPVQGGQHDQTLYLGTAEAVVLESGSSLSYSPFLFPTLAASPPTLAGGGDVALLLKGNPLALAWFFFALDVGPPTSFPGIDGAAVLASGAHLLVTVPLDAAGLGSFSLAVPPNPALAGLVAVFQALETGAPQKALSNPVFVTISG